jgi:GGDEF domain-containing protein
VLALTLVAVCVARAQDVPWGAAPGGDDPADVRDELQGDAQAIRQAIARLRARQKLPDGPAIDRPLNRSLAALWEIFRLVSHGHQDGTDAASETAARQAAATDRALQAAAARSRTHAAAMLARARYGSAAVILALFAAFAWVYLRALRARRSAERVALTDALTGLGNRRALTTGLQAAAGARMVALFDLDGFKQYNDTFGHPAGDALLARLGERLAGAVEGIGAAYRMGGDEFCVREPRRRRPRGDRRPRRGGPVPTRATDTGSPARTASPACRPTRATRIARCCWPTGACTRTRRRAGPRRLMV